jgi:GAF domain-containing protein
VRTVQESNQIGENLRSAQRWNDGLARGSRFGLAARRLCRRSAVRHIHSSAFHFAAGAAGFLLLSQSGERPEDTGSRVERRSSFPERQYE